MATIVATEAVARLAGRAATRTEADVQADIYVLLTAGALRIDPNQVARLEVSTADGTRRRLDVEIGHCVIEVKRDLRIGGVKVDAEKQLAGYVEAQRKRLGTRYVGLLTDGADWYLYHLEGSALRQVAELRIANSSPDPDRLIVWLESILGTENHIFPSPFEIQRRLSAESPGHALDFNSLQLLYRESAANPEVALKRDLWAKLLRTAFGKAFEDDEALFVNHTLLVLMAEIIAHAVIGFDVSRESPLGPQAMVRGTAFASSQIYGVVEADFFDWVLHADEGPGFVTELADRIGRFDWSHVDHDVLKILYESIITAPVRASLGEYYTPDWLADRVVNAKFDNPLEQRALDPACGSGTFLFHAARKFLSAADKQGIKNNDAISQLTSQLYGMDVHPVAVTLARVTYLMAIGSDRLSRPDRGPITVPVYLGDSLQWEQRQDLLGGQDVITISTAGDDLVEGGGGALFGDDLNFPRSVLKDAAIFDQLVGAMADKATAVSNRTSKDLIRPIVKQFGIHPGDAPTLIETFDTMRRLHSSGRNHIWGYYVRNLIRPLWLTDPDNKVDVLIGNPPWLRYSKMQASMQQRYKILAKERGLLKGALGASARDLSTLFVVRAVELYLKSGGTFGLVMPHGTLTRRPHEGFRSGRWSSTVGGQLEVAFDSSWDLSAAPTGFPMVSCVIFGERVDRRPVKMPESVELWKSSVRSTKGQWEAIKHRFVVTHGRVAVMDDRALPESPYRARFRQGAVLAPRMLLFVDVKSSGPLGAGAGRAVLASRRTTAEKDPWRKVPSLTGTVERAFVRDIHLGETLLPFRLLAPLTAVLPVINTGILKQEEVDEQPGLAEWWANAERSWERHKVAGDASALLDRIDFHGQLSAQLPTTTNRVMYTKAGNRIAAARLSGNMPLIDHKLYWCAVSTVAEARYLTAILNSSVLLERVKPMQALGLFGTRDFDKTIFHVPIPTFDKFNSEHTNLVSLATKAEEVVAQIEVDDSEDFKRTRTVIRGVLAESGVAGSIEAGVERVLPAVETLLRRP